jgi:hypothetical protein
LGRRSKGLLPHRCLLLVVEGLWMVMVVVKRVGRRVRQVTIVMWWRMAGVVDSGVMLMRWRRLHVRLSRIQIVVAKMKLRGILWVVVPAFLDSCQCRRRCGPNKGSVHGRVVLNWVATVECLLQLERLNIGLQVVIWRQREGLIMVMVMLKMFVE